MKKVIFISGHRDLREREFEEHYVGKLEEMVKDEEVEFVLADYEGVDYMAQCYLRDHLKDHKRVTIYHMRENPVRLASKLFKTVGGFKGDIERDSAMTRASSEDLAYIKKGRWNSGTAQNILRRFEI